MIDFLLGLFFASLFVRGWMRGLVREALDLVGVVAGILLAFRLGSDAGKLLGELTGISPEVSRLLGGAVIFVMVGLAAALAGHYLQRAVRLPGLHLSNRLGGAGLALAWGLFLATMVLSLLVVLPVPPVLAQQVQGSVVARTLTRPESPPQEFFQRLAGDRVVEALLNLRRLGGGRRLIVEEGQSIGFPAAEAAELAFDSQAATQVFQSLNRARRQAGLDPLAWSDALAEVAEGHAWEMYRRGSFSHHSPVTQGPADRVDAADIAYRLTGENLALAATPEAAHEGLMESSGHRANILHREFRRVGIGVVSGPLGLMVVQVFTG
ncbi:MAG: CvpA family protein [Actinomycetota bacterium]|nr:CvpA family protein [Actinomycetota bacterium]